MRKLSEKSSVVLLCVLSIMLLLQLSFSITCIQKEREALLQLKRSFEDSDERLASWNGTDCCNWNGVGCNQTTGHVTMIDLRRDYQVDFYSPLYSNSIDSSLLELKYLNYLDLSGNDFNYGQIPNFLGSMVELTYLNLSRAFFSGKVPPHLGNLTKLDALDLSFTWPQPNGDVEWISHLSSVRFLWLSGVDFSKASNLIKLLSSLPLLSSLKLRGCSLQNIHFSSSSLNYSSFLSRIQLLDLSYNYLNGSIPKTIQNMTFLKFLYLSGNGFTTIEGGLSSFIRINCGIKVFDLSKNSNLGDVFGSYENESIICYNGYDLQLLDLRYTSIRTKIPNWFGKLKNLQSLYLGDSQIYGPIPLSLGNLSKIEYLDLSSNALTGAIPTSFGRLLNLRELYLQYNRMEEVVEECFIQLKNLEVLDISKNSLKGVLTETHFANLSQLHTLYLGYNELLSLYMKPKWVPPFQLKYLDATSCIGFNGSEFPQWLQTQKAMLGLWLSNTSLSGSLPKWFTPQNLTTLDLSHNQMVGPLFTNIVDQMVNLKELSLNDNLIDDSLPHSLCKLKSLGYLDLSNNSLSGLFQGCLLTPKLILLDLSSNKFFGTFPYSHGNLSDIQQLYLGKNNFEGFMPVVLKNSKYLIILDLGGNKFSGNIPTWVGNSLGRLQFLRLRGNLFNGTIPSSLCNLTNLQMLDLAHNQLEGSIPQNLTNLKEMKMNYRDGLIAICLNGYDDRGQACFDVAKGIVSLRSTDFIFPMTILRFFVNIDLSNNSLVGFIPTEITMLKGLIGLNLSHNNLMGTIPTEIGEIESLESLDLSFNQLFGPIPQSLSKLNFLSMLKLSHNNFSGNIPQDLSTLFNDVLSFDDNPYLCGNLLLIKCAIENSSEPPFTNNLDQEEEDIWDNWLLYIMIILGFIVGFWAVVGTLILKNSWRYTYFKFVDEANYKVHATIWRSIEILKGIYSRK